MISSSFDSACRTLSNELSFVPFGFIMVKKMDRGGISIEYLLAGKKKHIPSHIFVIGAFPFLQSFFIFIITKIE